MVAGETRIHSQLAHSPLCIHREQLVTQKQRFCKTQELNLDSVMNVKFQVTEKKRKPKRTIKQTCNEMDKSSFTLQAYCSAVLILRRNLVWDTICIEMLRVINFKKNQEAEKHFGLHFTVTYSSACVARYYFLNIKGQKTIIDFFPACLNLCSMCVVLASIASLLLSSSTKKYACWETSLSLSCFAMPLSIWKGAKSRTVPLHTCWEMLWFRERQLLPHVPPGTGKWCATSQKTRVQFYPRFLWISLFA